MANPIPTRAGEKATPISAPPKSLASMLAAGMTAADMRRQAPASHSNLFDRRLGIRSEEEARAMTAAGLDKPFPKPTKAEQKQIQKPRGWERGDVAYDTKHSCKVTILAAAVGKTEDGILTHRVAAKGRAWVLRETRLKRV